MSPSVFIMLAFLQPKCRCTCHFNPKGHQTLLYVTPFLGRVSRDYFICLSVIVNYDFDLSVFIFPKSGVKIGQFVIIRHVIKYILFIGMRKL
jgi:hypothetical protein